jgi:hypothetical protein
MKPIDGKRAALIVDHLRKDQVAPLLLRGNARRGFAQGHPLPRGTAPVWANVGSSSSVYTHRSPPARRKRSRCGRGSVVEHHLAKVRVAGSNPVVRSETRHRFSPVARLERWSGREARQRPAKPYTRVRIPSPPRITARAIGAAVARFPDTEEVTGSIPVSPTTHEGRPGTGAAFVVPGTGVPLRPDRARGPKIWRQHLRIIGT